MTMRMRMDLVFLVFVKLEGQTGKVDPLKQTLLSVAMTWGRKKEDRNPTKPKTVSFEVFVRRDLRWQEKKLAARKTCVFCVPCAD